MTQKAAQAKVTQFIEALDEHFTEAERNDNPLMADLYKTFLNALRYRTTQPTADNKLTITLELDREAEAENAAVAAFRRGQIGR